MQQQRSSCAFKHTSSPHVRARARPRTFGSRSTSHSSTRRLSRSLFAYLHPARRGACHTHAGAPRAPSAAYMRHTQTRARHPRARARGAHMNRLLPASPMYPSSCESPRARAGAYEQGLRRGRRRPRGGRKCARASGAPTLSFSAMFAHTRCFTDTCAWGAAHARTRPPSAASHMRTTTTTMRVHKKRTARATHTHTATRVCSAAPGCVHAPGPAAGAGRRPNRR